MVNGKYLGLGSIRRRGFSNLLLPSFFVYCKKTGARQHLKVCMFVCGKECEEYRKRMREIGERDKTTTNTSNQNLSNGGEIL